LVSLALVLKVCRNRLGCHSQIVAELVCSKLFNFGHSRHSHVSTGRHIPSGGADWASLSASRCRAAKTHAACGHPHHVQHLWRRSHKRDGSGALEGGSPGSPESIVICSDSWWYKCFRIWRREWDSTHAQTDQGLAPILQGLPNEYSLFSHRKCKNLISLSGSFHVAFL